MINNEMKMAEEAQKVMTGIADGRLQITHVWSEKTHAPDDHQAWVLRIRTDHNHQLTFWMEGINIHILMGLTNEDGRKLFGVHNRVDAYGLLPVQIKLDLEKVVMEAHTHMCAAE